MQQCRLETQPSSALHVLNRTFGPSCICFPSSVGRCLGKGIPDKEFCVEVARGSLFELGKSKGACLGTWAWYSVQTPFVTLLLRTLRFLRTFGKAFLKRCFVSKFFGMFFALKAKKNAPGNTRHAPLEVPKKKSFPSRPSKIQIRHKEAPTHSANSRN